MIPAADIVRQLLIDLGLALPNGSFAQLTGRIVEAAFTANGAVSIRTNPWETQWCIAKILYEAAWVLMPDRLHNVIWSALVQLKQFVVASEERRGVFSHKKLAVASAPQHEIEILLDRAKLRMAVRMFASEQWSIAFSVTKHGRPAQLNQYRLLVVDKCRVAGGRAVVICENGQDIVSG